MKTITCFVFAALFFVASDSLSAQIYVKIRPLFTVTVRSVQPNPEYVWVEEEWVPYGNTYRYTGGHWEAPSRQGYYRTPGHWQTNKYGQRWVPGNWQSQNNKGKKHKHRKNQ